MIRCTVQAVRIENLISSRKISLVMFYIIIHSMNDIPRLNLFMIFSCLVQLKRYKSTENQNLIYSEAVYKHELCFLTSLRIGSNFLFSAFSLTHTDKAHYVSQDTSVITKVSAVKYRLESCKCLMLYCFIITHCDRTPEQYHVSKLRICY